jgi:hypothetical protein
MTDNMLIERKDQIEPRTRTLLLAVRQALIIALGALEDYLCIQRSIIPKHKRDG